MTQRQRPQAVPRAKCGWFHRRGAEQIQAEREATIAADQTDQKHKQKYAVRRQHVGYRLSIFKSAGNARRGKQVELRRLDFAKLSRCVRAYCSSTRRIGINRVRNDDGRIPHARTRAPCCCKYMKG